MFTLLPMVSKQNYWHFSEGRFVICHWCQRHRWCTLSCEYIHEFSKKFETALIQRRGGTLTYSWKKPEVEKILWHCLFNGSVSSSWFSSAYSPPFPGIMSSPRFMFDFFLFWPELNKGPWLITCCRTTTRLYILEPSYSLKGNVSQTLSAELKLWTMASFLYVKINIKFSTVY